MPAPSISACRRSDWHAAVSGDAVAQFFKQAGRSGALAPVDSFVEARDDLCGVGFQSLNDGAQGEDCGLIHAGLIA